MAKFHDIPSISISVTKLELRLTLGDKIEADANDAIFGGSFVMHGNQNYWPDGGITKINISIPTKDMLENIRDPYGSLFYRLPRIVSGRPNGGMLILTSMRKNDIHRLAHMFETKSIKSLTMAYDVEVPITTELDTNEPFSWMKLASENEAVGLKLINFTVTTPEYLLEA